MHLRSRFFIPLAFCAVLLTAAIASADFTAFVGTNRTAANRTVKGFGVGTGLVVVGFEFEYANTNEDPLTASPRLRTFMFNGLLQTPIPIARMQFYATAGGGVYRESLETVSLQTISETNFGINIGGGVKVTIAGPLRLRLDYRTFTLQGAPQYA